MIGVVKRVLVFGTFDGIHEGHRNFLREARTLGDFLVAAVAQDGIVEILKGKKPLRTVAQRISDLEKEGLVHEVTVGDEVLHSWTVIEKHRPDVIALGYDQLALKEALQEFLRARFPESAAQIRVMRPHEPEKYHSSILRKN